MKTNGESILIIGGGPSGMAAAVQLARQGHKPVIFEKNLLGGLLRNAGLVENYPGFPEGIRGDQLADLFEEQVRRWDIETVLEDVTSLDYIDKQFVAATSNTEFRAPIAIIATGTVPNPFNDCDIPDNVREKVLDEIYHIRQERDKRVAIIGAGDAAFDYALTMANHNQVTIINRTDTVKCLPLLQERARDAANIRYLSNTLVQSIGLSPCECVLIEYSNGKQILEISADYLVLAIGRRPQLGFLSEGLAGVIENLESRGLIYRIGDVINGNFRQTGIAVGDGIRTAMQIDQLLKGKTR